ncbi:MAG: hypothetical protein Q8907_02290 [Bacteroidota bacterium]|nr:hypothetical protein [Bacteroidota bacterium]
MSPYEIISVAFAFFALLISIYTIIDVRKNASAMVELAINERITNTKEKVSDVANIMTPIVAKQNRTDDENRMIELYEKQLDLAIENNLNAYEEASAKYIDKKVDKTRFMKLYKTEIRQLVEDENLKKYFDGVSSQYKAILKLYREWEDLEK